MSQSFWQEGLNLIVAFNLAGIRMPIDMIISRYQPGGLPSRVLNFGVLQLTLVCD